MEKSNRIRDLAIRLIAKGMDNPTRSICEKLGVTRQAVNRQLGKLLKEGAIKATGRTRDRRYSLNPLVQEEVKLKITPGLEEDRVWRESIRRHFECLPKNILDVCHYGFTEMLNNVIDHSESKVVTIRITVTAADISLTLSDNGIGIFEKIKREKNLEDHRHAILELAKGKLTTDRERHTGEGIFFTSRMFDEFVITSGALRFIHFAPKHDWLIESQAGISKGAHVFMKISLESKRKMRDIFNKFTAVEDDYGFSKTHLPVHLLQYGEENLVSRSQAKRLVSSLDKFKEVILDFKGVLLIGQAFADEIFRVFAKQHPEISFYQMNTNKAVEAMILRVKNV